MNSGHPDIVVVSPDGEYLLLVEVRLNDSRACRQAAIAQLQHLMAAWDCSAGLVVVGTYLALLRDSLEKSQGESITVVAEARLPEQLFPAIDDQWRAEHSVEFESRVQQWLEHLKQAAAQEALPHDSGNPLHQPINLINLLRLGEIRAAGPRWSRVAS